MMTEDEEEEERERRQSLPWSPFYTTGSLLEPDADEVLLGLLARDNEPPPKPEKPHRRWVRPPIYGTSHDGVWHEIAPDWWEVTPRKVYWAREEERRKAVVARYRERAALAAFVRYHLPVRRPVVEWLNQWLADPRYPDPRFPDAFFTRRGPWF